MKEKPENLGSLMRAKITNNMKYGVIDIGSNSVRLMISVDGKTIDKYVKTTRLAENMEADNNLQIDSIERTACAVSFFVDKAKEVGADKIYIFATAAVRQAKNKQVFLSQVKDLTSIDVDVIQGELEAKLGAMGALNGCDGGIIDVGGASSEVMVIKNGEKTVYGKAQKGSTEPEPDAVAFPGNTKAMSQQYDSFDPGTLDKYTVVIWLEGEDPECIDDIKGGQVRMSMHFSIVDA